MRIDKFLKLSRIIKRRTVAADATSGGRVKVNEKSVKPAYQLKVGDVVSISFGEGTFKFRVLSVDFSPKLRDVETMYQVLEQ
jgi:ribosomal 50S subunit-recycling heat shock protein